MLLPETIGDVGIMFDDNGNSILDRRIVTTHNVGNLYLSLDLNKR